MPSRTKAGLNLADKNSYVRVEENINDNLLKIDDDVDGMWGGLYGGYIQDETITKEVGKRYIDEFNKKAYICIKPSNVNTEDAYTECNVVSNLGKLQSLFNIRDVNIIELNNKTLLVSVNINVKNGEIRDFSSSYGFCQKYVTVPITSIITKPDSIYPLGCYVGSKTKNGIGWVSGMSASVGYSSGIFHLYLSNPTMQYDWSDQSVTFSFIAKY